MDVQTIFKRYELKYLLTKEQKDRLLEKLQENLVPDPHGETTIRNIYFDTENYQLIRRSLEKPVYKEKLRVRSYCQADPDSPVFVELKKKYRGVVYKRRISLPETDAMSWLSRGKSSPENTQISREIDYFLNFYPSLGPAGFISYRREAFYAKNQPDFRVTFDCRILFRQGDLSLKSKVYGILLIPRNMVLMELKCPGAMPLWAAKFLSEERIYQTSFSKYGTAYQKVILPGLEKEVRRYA